jgi:hypothetical protein
MARNIAQEAAREMDEMLADVMPDSWIGHARLRIADADIPESKHALAERVSSKLVERKGVSAETAAEAAITQIKNKA